MNSFGRHFRLTTFGESHGSFIGGVIDGCPAGVQISEEKILAMLNRRKSKHPTSTPRREEDQPIFIAGLKEWVTTGAPIAFLFQNKDTRSQDYDALAQVFRPSHSDYTYHQRYGGYEERRGGGRASARESSVRVVAGAIAMQLLEVRGIEIVSYTSQIGDLVLEPTYHDTLTAEEVVASKVGCPLPELDDRMDDYLKRLSESGDTVGGVVATIVRGVPAGWGSPLYAKLDAKLAEAMLGINAAKGFEVGSGFAISAMKGSEANDPFVMKEGKIGTRTNHSGGIQGGISNGEVLRFRTAFKPISSISLPQESVKATGEAVTLTVQGRHDSSVFPRVLPIVDAMTALVLVDEMLASQSYFLEKP